MMFSFGWKKAGVVGLLLVSALLFRQPAVAQEPIKIGAIYSMSGPYAVIGLGIGQAIRLAFEEEGSTVGGRKVELIFIDDEGKPDVGLARIRESVERDKVDILLSINSTAVGIAVRDYVAGKNIPWVTLSSSAGLTRDKGGKYIFRVAPSNYQWAYGVAKWLREKRHWDKVVWIGSNYASPREAFNAIKKVYTTDDSVPEAVWPSVGAPDYAPFLGKLESVKANGALVAVWGSDALKFVSQYSDYGLNKKIPVFGLASFASEEVLPGMPAAIEGVESAYLYCGTLDTPANKKFVSGYEVKAKSAPGAYQYMGYVGAKLTIQAIKDVKGNVADRDAFVKALEKAHVLGPMGDVSFDDRHSMVSDFYVMKVRKSGSGFENECLDRIPQVRDPYEQFP
jgi:branched-chain amino acid transport system substrate-binding protein